MKTLFTTWFAALISVASFAQAPGGVSTGLVSWFKADAGSSTTTNGATVASWQDQSGRAMHALQANNASRPLYSTNIINGHPAMRTSTARFFNVDWSIINDTNYTIYAVTQRLAGGNFNNILGIQGTTATNSFLTLGYASSTLVRHIQYGNMLSMTTENYNLASEIPTIMACQFNEAIGKGVWRIRDGVNTSAAGTNKTHFPYPAGIRGRIGRGGEGYGFNGYIAEVFVYDRVLTNTEKARINTYLSVKYGLSVPAAEHQYALDPAHHNDVFGIAQDNTFALAQTTSESVSLDDILRISSPSAMSNGDYLICGNDNGAVTFGAYAGSNCSISRIMAREWKFNHINDCGTVELRFDLTGVTGFNAADLRLVVDLDGDEYDDETPLTGVYAAPFFTVSGVAIPDDAKMTLCSVNTHYYAVTSGVSDAMIWSTSPTGAAEFTLTNTCPSIDLTVNAGVILQVNGVLTCSNLTVNGTLNLGDDQADNLIVHGDIQMNGSWISPSAPGSLSFHGDAAQAVNGGVISVYNADITNPAGVTLNNTRLDIRYNLAITDFGVLNTNGKLRLVSNANGTGEIQSLEAGTINGTVTVERYRPAVAAGWVNLCSPVTGATLAEWNDDIITTGFPGSDSPNWPSAANPYVSIKWYNEALPGTEQDGYVGVTNVTNPLVPGMGFMVYMPVGPATIDYPNYTINSGDHNLPVTYAPTNNGSGRGWNMVGNPYPATISWSSGGWVKSNMSNEVYVWNPNSRQYESYTGAIGGTLLIAPGQSFFVRADGLNPVLTVRESCKTKGHGTFRSMEASNEYLTIQVKKDDLQDKTILMRMENMTKSFDTDYDAFKLRSPDAEVPYLATVDQEGEDLSINVFNDSSDETIIPIRIEAAVSGIYQLSVTGLDAFAQGGCVTLEDVFTGASYVITEDKPVGLELTAGDHTLRYQLRIGAPVVAAVTDAGCSLEEGGVAQVNVPANATEAITWYTAQGEFVGATSPENGIASIGGLQAGSYVAKLNHNGACGVSEVAFEVAQLKKLGATAVVMPASCENTEDGAISISMSGGEAPFSIEWNSGAEGSMIENTKAGKYIATVTDVNGCSGRFEFEVPSVSQLLSKFESSHDKVELVNGQATVEFTNTSRDAETVTWNFGDGSDEDSNENPSHTYINPGTYEVMLKATHDNCESVSTKTIAVTDESHAEEFAGDILATLTDQGVKMTFFFDEQKNLQINAYNVLGQQLIEPITGVYDNQTIMFSERRYAAQALIEITDLSTGEKALIRLGR